MTPFFFLYKGCERSRDWRDRLIKHHHYKREEVGLTTMCPRGWDTSSPPACLPHKLSRREEAAVAHAYNLNLFSLPILVPEPFSPCRHTWHLFHHFPSHPPFPHPILFLMTWSLKSICRGVVAAAMMTTFCSIRSGTDRVLAGPPCLQTTA